MGSQGGHLWSSSSALPWCDLEAVVQGGCSPTAPHTGLVSELFCPGGLSTAWDCHASQSSPTELAQLPLCSHPRPCPFGRWGRARMGHLTVCYPSSSETEKVVFVLDVWGWSSLLLNGKSGSEILILCFYCFENGQIWKIIKTIRRKMNITHLSHRE